MRLWFALVVLLLVSACMPQNTIPTPVVEIIEVPFVEPTATPDCLHTDGVILELSRISDTRVALHISGLQPGEIPYITFNTFTRYSDLGFTSGGFVEGADTQGNFSFEHGGLFPPEGETNATWDIRFIHARGVECATITLP